MQSQIINISHIAMTCAILFNSCESNQNIIVPMEEKLISRIEICQDIGELKFIEVQAEKLLKISKYIRVFLNSLEPAKKEEYEEILEKTAIAMTATIRIYEKENPEILGYNYDFCIIDEGHNGFVVGKDVVLHCSLKKWNKAIQKILSIVLE